MREIERLQGLPEWRIYMQSCVSLRIHRCFLHIYWCWMLFAGTPPIQALNKFFHCGKPWGPTSTDAWMSLGIKSLFQSKNRSIKVTQCTLNHVWRWEKRAFLLHRVHVGPGCAKVHKCCRISVITERFSTSIMIGGRRIRYGQDFVCVC